MRSAYSREFIRDCIRRAFPDATITGAHVLSGGLINTNIKVELSSRRASVVLRLYQGDSAVCLKETAVLCLVRPTVPVPEVIYVEPDGLDGHQPFCILEFVNGLTFRQLKQTNDVDAIRQAAAASIDSGNVCAEKLKRRPAAIA